MVINERQIVGYRHFFKPKLLKVCQIENAYHLVGGVVSLQLLMSRVLHVNGVVSDDGGHRRVVAHHRLCTLLAGHF